MTYKFKSFLIQLADAADAISLRYFQSKDFVAGQKSDATFVTQADHEIEEAVSGMARNAYPEIAIVGEEYGEIGSGSLRLYIDPIDSTHNFITGIPLFATLLAIESDGEVVASMVSAPGLRCRWSAQKGAGSYLNGKRMSVSSVSNLTQATVFHGSLFGQEAKETPKSMLDLLAKTSRQRGFGDFYAHMLVAMGAGEIAVDFGMKPWDIAPIPLIVREAGGGCTDAWGRGAFSSGSLVSTNGILTREVVSYFQP